MKATFDVALRIDCELPEGVTLGVAQDAVHEWLAELILRQADSGALRDALHIAAIGPLDVRSR